VTGGTRGNANAGFVQLDQDVFPFDKLKRNVRRVWQALRTAPDPIHSRIGDLVQNGVFEFVSQRLNVVMAAIAG
jgi:hypothetical protein